MKNFQHKLFIDPKIKYPCYNLELNFDDYITQYKSIIASTRLDLTPLSSKNILNANSPFELKPHILTKPKVGVLLIHGLLDCPLHLRDIGEQLLSQGYLVRAILLPGHGTVPGALLNVSYTDWLKSVQYGIESLNKKVEKIILIGQSTGASLALYKAIETSKSIAGVILLSPALKIRSTFAPIANWYRTVNWACKRAAWFHINSEETLDYAKYMSLPYNAIYQVYLLSKKLNELEHYNNPSCPLFFVVSQDDKIICPKTIVNYFHQHTNPQSLLLLYTNHQHTFVDSRIQIKSSIYPKQHIKNFSHIGIPISPLNMHYGKRGDFKYSSHVNETKNVIYGEYLRNDLFYNQWQLKLGMTKYKKERLTFNPDFNYMSTCIKNFIERIIL